jgi:hypothetical protein
MKWSLEASESASQAHLKPAQISMHFTNKMVDFLGTNYRSAGGGDEERFVP